MANRKPLRILHTSDVHLLSLSEGDCNSIGKMVDVAIQSKVDLVLIAGDFFDHNRVDDDIVRFAIQQLQRLPVGVVILPGNHDCLSPDSVYHRKELWRGATNVSIFRDPHGETLSFPDLGVSMWGKANISYENDLRPMGDIPQTEGNGQWHIAVAHGYFYNSAAPLLMSYHITPEEIAASGRDYVALGHLVTFQCVCRDPVAYYSGSPSQTGTMAIVDLAEETGVQVTRHTL
ncbi:MAG: DNA repair exonuclease [Dehalococcoidales bacterium]|nr:DNA repair exonuclease [Dehalococcoidales bacterium]